jgi:pyruvate dehydrogenase E1 component beta subunit
MLYSQAISQSMVEAMERDPKVVLLGQNVTTTHGVFDTTTEAYRRFPERCIEAPISEAMLTGACVGLAMEGWKPILVHTRADFSLFSFEHLINTAAKLPFLRGKPLPFVMRCVVGRGWGQGPVHSQSFHNLLAQIPGVEVLIPASGASYERHMGRALEAGHPVVIIEPRRLYERHDVATQDLEGRAGVTIVTIGDTIIEAVEAKERLKAIGYDPYIVPYEDMGLSVDLGRMAAVMVDMAPRRPWRGIVAPPFKPLGVSRAYERAWYPTADDIVEEVCRILGRKAPPREERYERVVAGSPF